MSGRNNNTRPYATSEDRQKYNDAWAKMMVDIWREKIERLHVIDTYSLHQEITENVTSSGGDLNTIQHKFMEYGIYQDCGTGNGYRKDNGGNLEFLDVGINRVNHVNGFPVLTLRQSWYLKNKWRICMERSSAGYWLIR